MSDRGAEAVLLSERLRKKTPRGWDSTAGIKPWQATEIVGIDASVAVRQSGSSRNVSAIRRSCSETTIAVEKEAKHETNSTGR